MDSRQAGVVNEPDFLDALRGILPERGWSWSRFFATFAAWRYFTGPRDDGHHFADGALWGARSLSEVRREVMTSAPLVVRASLGAFGASLVELDVSGLAAVEVRLSGDEAAAALVPLDTSGAARAEPVIALPGIAARLDLVAGTTRVLVALTHAPLVYDPDLPSASPTEVSASISAVREAATDAGLADGGMVPVPGGGAGFGCALAREGAGNSAGGVGFLLFALLVLLSRGSRSKGVGPR